MMDSGSGGGAFTGHLAESPELMLNALRLGLALGAAVGFGDTESPAGMVLCRLRDTVSAPAVTGVLSACSVDCSVTVRTESPIVSAVTGVLRGIRIARGDQRFGWTSQSCSSPTVCWATTPDEPLPQPMRKAVRNALVLVERKVRNPGEEPFMSPIQGEMLWKSVDRNDLQG